MIKSKKTEDIGMKISGYLGRMTARFVVAIIIFYVLLLLLNLFKIHLTLESLLFITILLSLQKEEVEVEHV